MKTLLSLVVFAIAGLALPAASSGSVAPSPDGPTCSARSLPSRLQSLKAVPLAKFKKLPRGVSRSGASLVFDPKLWTVKDLGQGVIGFKKKKKGNAKFNTFTTCMCSEGANGPGCQTNVDNETGSISCQANGCEATCNKKIYGTPKALSDSGFVTESL